MSMCQLTKQLPHQIINLQPKIQIHRTNLFLQFQSPATKIHKKQTSRVTRTHANKKKNDSPIIINTVPNRETKLPKDDNNFKKNKKFILERMKLLKIKQQRRNKDKMIENKRMAIYNQPLFRSRQAHLNRTLSIQSKRLNYIHGIHNRIDLSMTECEGNERRSRWSEDAGAQLRELISIRARSSLAYRISRFVEARENQQINLKANSIYLASSVGKRVISGKSEEKEVRKRIKFNRLEGKQPKDRIKTDYICDDGLHPWSDTSNRQSMSKFVANPSTIILPSPDNRPSPSSVFYLLFI